MRKKNKYKKFQKKQIEKWIKNSNRYHPYFNNIVEEQEVSSVLINISNANNEVSELPIFNQETGKNMDNNNDNSKHQFNKHNLSSTQISNEKRGFTLYNNSHIINNFVDNDFIAEPIEQNITYNNSLVTNNYYSSYCKHNDNSRKVKKSIISMVNHSNNINPPTGPEEIENFNNNDSEVSKNSQKYYQDNIYRNLSQILTQQYVNKLQHTKKLSYHQEEVKKMTFYLAKNSYKANKSYVESWKSDRPEKYLDSLASLMTIKNDISTAICITDKYLLITNKNIHDNPSLSVTYWIKIWQNYFLYPFNDGYNELMNHAYAQARYKLNNNENLQKSINYIFGTNCPKTLEGWIALSKQISELPITHQDTLSWILEPITACNIIVEDYSKGLIDYRLIEAIKNYNKPDSTKCNLRFIKNLIWEMDAEMIIVDYLYNNLQPDNDSTIYKFGLSQYSCACCSIGLIKFQDFAKNIWGKTIEFDISGSHAKFLPAWLSPEFLAPHMRGAFGEFMYEKPIYNNIKEHRTLSFEMFLKTPFIATFKTAKELEENIIKTQGSIQDMMISIFLRYATEESEFDLNPKKNSTLENNIKLLIIEWIELDKETACFKAFANHYQNDNINFFSTERIILGEELFINNILE